MDRITFGEFKAEVVVNGEVIVCSTTGGFAEVRGGNVDLVCLDSMSYTDPTGCPVRETAEAYQLFMNEVERFVMES